MGRSGNLALQENQAERAGVMGSFRFSFFGIVADDARKMRKYWGFCGRSFFVSQSTQYETMRLDRFERFKSLRK